MLLASVDQKMRCPGDGRTPPLRARWGTKIRCAEEQVVGLWIDCHGLGAIFRLNGVDLAKFVSRVLVEDVDLPRAARGNRLA